MTQAELSNQIKRQMNEEIQKLSSKTNQDELASHVLTLREEGLEQAKKEQEFRHSKQVAELKLQRKIIELQAKDVKEQQKKNEELKRQVEQKAYDRKHIDKIENENLFL